MKLDSQFHFSSLPSRFHSFTVTMILLNFVLTILFGALSVLYLFKKWKTFSKTVLQQELHGNRSEKKINSRTVKRITHFRVTVPFLDGLYALHSMRKYGISAVDSLIEKAGPEQDDICEFPLGPFSVIFSKDAKVSHKLLSSSDPGHLSRPNSIYGKILVDILEGGLLRTPHKIWSPQRKIVARAFTFRSFKSYTESMNKHSKRLVEALSLLTMDNNGEIAGAKMNDCIHLNTIKIALEFIMGSEISDCEETLQFSKEFWELKEIVVYRFLHPEFYAPFVWWFHPKRRQYKVLMSKMYAFMRKIVEHYEKKAESHQNLDSNDNGEGVNRCLIEELLKYKVPAEEIFCEIATFLVAGHETISVAMNLLLHHLACHPEYQARCRAEVDNVMDQCDDLKIDDLSKLEYLERFIMESLRISPTVPFTVREMNTPLQIDEGCTIEKGKLVVIPIWIIHHNPKYYPQPEIFDPDRFLPEEMKTREPGTFIPFSGGLRNCIGKRFAMLEMKSVLALILRNFEIHTKDGLHDVKLFFEGTLRPERDFRTSLKMRNLTSRC